MRSLLIPAVALGMVVSGASFAQSSMNSHSQPASPPVSQQGSSPNQRDRAPTTQKLKQDLQNAGFTDVNVTAESFLVQAKSKDGNPVLMAIGPDGFTALEAIHRNPPPSAGATENSGSAATQK
jgi:hypothetical protein